MGRRDQDKKKGRQDARRKKWGDETQEEKKWGDEMRDTKKMGGRDKRQKNKETRQRTKKKGGTTVLQIFFENLYFSGFFLAFSLNYRSVVQ